MKATVKKTPGGLGRPVCCCGVYVAPGDLVLGDDDGVVVVRLDRLAETLQRALERTASEEEILASLKQGKTTLELLGLQGALAGPGSVPEGSSQ
jgi:4-hydroxy-4-methyl-2-oxoglutarate aldolase